jgi:RHS repeat-associated protein
LRDEVHYSGNRVAQTYVDRRTLDRSDVGARSDDSDARFLVSDYLYAPGGLLTTKIMPNGSTVDYVYDGYRELYKVTKNCPGQPTVPVARYFIGQYLELLRVVEGEGSSKLITVMDRNAAGFVTRVTQPAAATPGSWYPQTPAYAIEESDYSVVGLVTERRVKDGATQALMQQTRFVYDEILRLKTLTNVLLGSSPQDQSFLNYWSGGHLARVEGPAGRFVEYFYDGLSRLIEERDSHATNPNKRLTDYQAKTNWVQRVTRQLYDEKPGQTGYVNYYTEYVRDALGRATEVHDGPPNDPQNPQLVHRFAYYSTGFTESYTDPAGKLYNYLPDALGRLNEHFLPGSQPIWNETIFQDWTSATTGRTAMQQTDGRGRITKTFYDFAGRPIIVMDPGASTEPTSSAPSQPLSRFAVYNALSEVTDVYAGDGIQEQVFYDGARRMIARQTPSAGLGTNGNGLSAVSWYHGRDILVRDALGRVVTSDSFYGPAAEAMGRYSEEMGQWDGLSRRQYETFNTVVGPGSTVSVQSTHDGVDPFRQWMKVQTTGFGADDLAVEFIPDSTGRVGEVHWQFAPIAPENPNPTLLVGYNHVGSLQSLKQTNYGAHTGITDFEYDVYGRMTHIDTRLDSQPSSPFSTFDYVYDLASDLTKELYAKQGAPSAVGDRFAYDEHHRLAKAWLGTNQANSDPDTGTFVKRLTYGLDAANNRTTVDSKFGSPSGSGSTDTYTTQDGAPQGPSNRYQSVQSSQLVALEYDQRGNTTFDGTYYYVYDELNRLTEVYRVVSTIDSGTTLQSQAAGTYVGSPQQYALVDRAALSSTRTAILAGFPGGPQAILNGLRNPAMMPFVRRALPSNAVSRLTPSAGQLSSSTSSSSSAPSGDPQLALWALYLYDANGRRVVRVVMGIGTYSYAYDGWEEIQEASANGSTAVPQVQLVYGEELDEMLAFRAKDNTSGAWSSRFVVEGGAHCPGKVVDGNGTVLQSQEYDPYGATTAYGYIDKWAFGWKSHRIDPETGLLYMRCRHYSVTLGRFMSIDPVGTWSDGVELGNGYCYGGNSPLVNSDPMGLQVSPFGTGNLGVGYQRARAEHGLGPDKLDPSLSDGGDDRPTNTVTIRMTRNPDGTYSSYVKEAKEAIDEARAREERANERVKNWLQRQEDLDAQHELFGIFLFWGLSTATAEVLATPASPCAPSAQLALRAKQAADAYKALSKLEKGLLRKWIPGGKLTRALGPPPAGLTAEAMSKYLESIEASLDVLKFSAAQGNAGAAEAIANGVMQSRIAAVRQVLGR